MIVKIKLSGSKGAFDYGRYSHEDRLWLTLNKDAVVEAERYNINYYRIIANDFLVHVYECREVVNE